jgi:heat shock protein HtpX
LKNIPQSCQAWFCCRQTGRARAKKFLPLEQKYSVSKRGGATRNMANLYKHKDSNIRKTWFLITVFLIIVIGFGWLISYIWQSPVILYFAIVLALVMNITAYWKSDKIALAMSGAKPAPREKYIELHRLVENLAITAGLPKPRVYIIPGHQINAFATGRDPEHAAVAVTEGTLAKLNKIELEGVVAHELSHIGNRDILISSIVVVLVGLIAILADVFLRMTFFSSLGEGRNNRSGGGGGAMIVVGIIAAILVPIVAMIIQLSISRKREFLADASGALLSRYPEGLASALDKIGQDQNNIRHAHNATAHLFIANPFKGKEGKNWFVRLFMTHPPVQERIKILRGMKM